MGESPWLSVAFSVSRRQDRRCEVSESGPTSQPSGKIRGLQDFLGPERMDEFVDAYVNQSPLFVHGPAERAAYLLGPDTLNDIVAQGVHTEGRLAATLEEKLVPRDQYTLRETPPRIDPTALKQLLVRGGSVTINEIDDIVPAIGDLAQSLEWTFGSNVWVSAYASFGRSGYHELQECYSRDRACQSQR
jgi:hypothetical protein